MDPKDNKTASEPPDKTTGSNQTSSQSKDETKKKTFTTTTAEPLDQTKPQTDKDGSKDKVKQDAIQSQSNDDKIAPVVENTLALFNQTPIDLKEKGVGSNAVSNTVPTATDNPHFQSEDKNELPNQSRPDSKGKPEPKNNTVLQEQDGSKKDTVPLNQTPLQTTHKVNSELPAKQLKSKGHGFQENTVPSNKKSPETYDKKMGNVKENTLSSVNQTQTELKFEVCGFEQNTEPSNHMQLESKDKPGIKDGVNQNLISLNCTADENKKILQLEQLTGIHDLAFCKHILAEHQWNVELTIEKQFRKAYPSAYASDSREESSYYDRCYPVKSIYRSVKDFFKQKLHPPTDVDSPVSGGSKTADENINVVDNKNSSQSSKDASTEQDISPVNEVTEHINNIVMWISTPRCTDCSYNSNLNSDSDCESVNPVACFCKKILELINMNCSVTSYPCECDVRKILLTALLILLWIGSRPTSGFKRDAGF